LSYAIFASEEGIVSRLGVKDGQKCPWKDSNVSTIMLTTPCRISGDHPSLTLVAQILLQLVSLSLHVGWDAALFAGKYSCSLSPLERGLYRTLVVTARKRRQRFDQRRHDLASRHLALRQALSELSR
jgi:hypothetical protein